MLSTSGNEGRQESYGGYALLAALMPCLGVIIGLFSLRNRRKMKACFGGSAVGLVLMWLMALEMDRRLHGTVSDYGGTQLVVYRVTGSAPTADISGTNTTGHGLLLVGLVKLPWKYSFRAGPGMHCNIMATNKSKARDVTVEILVDGKSCRKASCSGADCTTEAYGEIGSDF